MNNSLKHEINITFNSISENEKLARVVIGTFIARADPTVEQLEDVKTAVSEAVTNAIVHGYQNANGVVTMQASLEDNVLEIIIEDTGVGIEDVHLAMEPFYTTITDGTRSGMGFCMMEAFMDEVCVKSRPFEGTKVIMKKDLKNKSPFLLENDEIMRG